jgi:hypothetical protein
MMFSLLTGYFCGLGDLSQRTCGSSLFAVDSRGIGHQNRVGAQCAIRRCRSNQTATRVRRAEEDR